MKPLQLFRSAHTLRLGVRAGMILLMTVVAETAMAARTPRVLPNPRVELQAGRSYMDGSGTAAVFAEGIFAEHSIGSSPFTWAPDLSAGWIDSRNMRRFRHARYTVTDSIWLVAAGARFRYGVKGSWYHHLFFSFQPALHTGRTQALSSTYEFVSTLGWQASRLSVQVRHISNGSLHEPNRGETMVLLGVRFGAL